MSFECSFIMNFYLQLTHSVAINSFVSLLRYYNDLYVFDLDHFKVNILKLIDGVSIMTLPSFHVLPQA